MKLIDPITITQSKIVSYNVAQDVAIWSASTTYEIGAKVVLDSFGSVVYESIIASNVGNAPATSPTKWLALNASNYSAMFDTKNGTQTSNTNTITLTINTPEMINAIGFANVSASSIRVQVTDATYGNYDKTITLKTLPAYDWYTFYTGEFIYQTKAIFDDLPPYRSTNIVVTITSEAVGGLAKVGAIIFGKLESIGNSHWGVELGFVDYSRKEADDFGNYEIIERAYAETLSATVEIETIRIATVQALRAKLRAKPVLMVGTVHYQETLLFGFFNAFDISLDGQFYSQANVKFTGLT